MKNVLNILGIFILTFLQVFLLVILCNLLIGSIIAFTNWDITIMKDAFSSLRFWRSIIALSGILSMIVPIINIVYLKISYEKQKH